MRNESINKENGYIYVLVSAGTDAGATGVVNRMFTRAKKNVYIVVL